MASKHKEPVSRFWACFFASGIVALLWTYKMKITKKWLSVVVCIWIVNITASVIINDMVDDTVPANQFFYDQLLAQSTSLLILSHTISVGLCVVLIYFMFRWTTVYNLAYFGYKSKKEWKRYGMPKFRLHQAAYPYTMLDRAKRLLDLGVGDTERIRDICDTLKKKKSMYVSDSEYLRKMLEEHGD